MATAALQRMGTGEGEEGGREGGREGDCKENKSKKKNSKHDTQEGDGEKVTVEKEGLTMGQERREVHVTGET